jgi:hypothetical protein
MSRPPSDQTSPTPEAAPGKLYPYLLHRTYLCGHPDECIEVDLVSSLSRSPVIQHTHIPLPQKPRCKPYQQTLERCPQCAKHYQAQRRQAKSSEPVRSLAAYQGHIQGGKTSKKDGFLQTIARYRFQNTPRVPVVWKDEGPDDSAHTFLKNMHDQAMAERDYKSHTAVPYRARRDKHVIGPTVEANRTLTYAIMVHVDEALIPPPREPTPPPETHRHSDSVIMGGNRRGWSDKQSNTPPQGLPGSRRDFGGTSLSFGDQPRHSTQRSEPNQGRGGQPLPVFKNRRDMLRERVAAPSPRNASPHAAQSPQSPHTPSSADSARSVSGQPNQSPYGSFNRNPYGVHVANAQEGVARQQSPRRSPYATRSPYEYAPLGPLDETPSIPLKSPRRRASEGTHSRYHDVPSHPHGVYGSPSHGSVADADRGPYGYSPRGGDERADASSFGSARGNDARRASARAEPNQYLQPGPREEDSDSDASSIGKW